MSKKVKDNPLLDAKEIQEMVKLNTEATLKSIMEQTIKENMKKMIKEADDDDYEEVEEVEVGEENEDTPIEGGGEENPVDVDVDVEVGEEEGEEDFSEFQVDDDTLDLTGASDEDLIKVFKKVQNDTEVQVTKTEDGVEICDNETGAEYIIDLDCGVEEVEDEYELDEANLGYTDTYQRPTGINIPQGKGFQGNKPLGDKNSPNKDGQRNYAQSKGDSQPFTESEEVPVDENVTRTMAHKRYRATAMPDPGVRKMNMQKRAGAFARDGGQLTDISESKISQLEKRVQKLLEDNKILTECVKQFKEAAQSYYVTSREVAMTNFRLGKAFNLVMENSTTLEEKQNILERLQNCKTEKEVNSLHEVIKSELKNKQPLQESINKGFEVQEKTVTEKPIFINEEVQKTLGFMNRVLAV